MFRSQRLQWMGVRHPMLPTLLAGPGPETSGTLSHLNPSPATACVLHACSVRSHHECGSCAAHSPTSRAPLCLTIKGSQIQWADLLASHGFSCHNFRGRSWRPWNYYRRSDGSTNCWTNLICGHNSVARWVGGDWRRELLSEYCKEQRCTININQNHTIGATKARRGHGRGELVCRDVCG
jgi:hypothetical protein